MPISTGSSFERSVSFTLNRALPFFSFCLLEKKILKYYMEHFREVHNIGN